MSFPTGCIIDPAASDSFRADLGKPFAWEAKPSLKGRWQATIQSGVFGVFLWEAERKLTGKIAQADRQARGTCTSRGMYKALMRSMSTDIADGALVGRFVRPAFAPIYVGARIIRGFGKAVPFGRSCSNCGDGTVVADAAKHLHDFGGNTIEDHPDFATENTAEAWAINNGYRGFQIPESLRSVAHKCRAMEAKTDAELADVIAAGNAGALGGTLYGSPSASRDQNGMITKTANGGGHTEAVTGVYLTSMPKDLADTSEVMSCTAFVTEGSWFPWPSGPEMIQVVDGPVRLPPGAYASPAANVRKAIQNGECWCVEVKEGWR